MSVTIKEIARHTGLSIPTVGNILGRSASRYSPDTRKRVLTAAQSLGYKPNASARAVRQGRFGCAALVLNRSRQSTHSHIPVRLVDGLEDELNLNDMHLTVSRLSDEELSTNDFVPKVLREHMADGMIVNYTHEIPPRMLEMIHAHHTPAVWLNAKLRSDCVYPDDLIAARKVTDHLIALGHRRITLVHTVARFPWQSSFAESWAGRHYSVEDRAGGYREAMSAAGLAPEVLSHERFINESESFNECRALLAGPDRPTAVLAYSEGEVQSLICAAASLGLSIPLDLSVVVFAPMSQWIAGHLVTIAAIPTEEIGRVAVRMLLEKLASFDVDCKPVAVQYGLDARGQTVAAPPHARAAVTAQA